MSFKPNEIVCEALLVTGTTTDQELIDFGVNFAERGGDGTMNIELIPNGVPQSFSGVDVYVVKTVSSPFRRTPLFDFVTPDDFASWYTEV